jgi:hypothetical protein
MDVTNLNRLNHLEDNIITPRKKKQAVVVCPNDGIIIIIINMKSTSHYSVVVTSNNNIDNIDVEQVLRYIPLSEVIFSHGMLDLIMETHVENNTSTAPYQFTNNIKRNIGAIDSRDTSRMVPGKLEAVRKRALGPGGRLHPVQVRSRPNFGDPNSQNQKALYYEVLDGRHRVCWSVIAGHTHVPALVIADVNF